MGRINICGTFTEGNKRAIISNVEYPTHPWLKPPVCQSNLACWNDEYGSWLPDPDLVESDVVIIDSYKMFEKVIKDAQKAGIEPVFYPITHFDKYGGVVLHKPCNLTQIKKYDGAIFTLKPDYNTVANLEYDFNCLNAYMGGGYFEIVTEKQCKECGSWQFQTLVDGFVCTSWDQRLKMLENMCNTLPKGYKSLTKQIMNC